MSVSLPSMESQVGVPQQTIAIQIAIRHPISGEPQLSSSLPVVTKWQRPELVVGKLTEAQLANEAFPALGMFVRFQPIEILSDKETLVLSSTKELMQNNPFLTTWNERLEMAVSMYGNGLISLGRASEMAEVDYEGMIEILESRGIPLNFGPRTPEEADRQERRFLESVKRKQIPVR